MTHRTITKQAFVCVASVASLLAGCAAPDRVTHENYAQVRAKVHTGDDVIALLGEPESKLDGLWLYQRPDQHLYVKIEFDDKGKVSRTEWIDAGNENWEDTKDKK